MSFLYSVVLLTCFPAFSFYTSKHFWDALLPSNLKCGSIFHEIIKCLSLNVIYFPCRVMNKIWVYGFLQIIAFWVSLHFIQHPNSFWNSGCSITSVNLIGTLCSPFRKRTVISHYHSFPHYVESLWSIISIAIIYKNLLFLQSSLLDNNMLWKCGKWLKLHDIKKSLYHVRL